MVLLLYRKKIIRIILLLSLHWIVLFDFRLWHLSICLMLKMAINCSAVLAPTSLPLRYVIWADLTCKNLVVKDKKIMSHWRSMQLSSAQDNCEYLGKSTMPGKADINTSCQCFLNTHKSVPQTLYDREVSINLITQYIIFLRVFVSPFMNDVKFVESCDKDFPCKIVLFCEEIFLQLPLLRVLKIKRRFQKEQYSSVVKLKFGQLQPIFLNLPSKFIKLIWVKDFLMLLNTISYSTVSQQQVNLFVFKKISSEYLGIKSTTQKYKNTAVILLTLWKSHGMHYGICCTFLPYN